MIIGLILNLFSTINPRQKRSSFYMKPNPHAEILPSLLEAIKGQLTPSAVPLLVRAFESKQISTTEIAELLLPDFRIGVKFTNAIKVFTAIFRQYGVRVTFAALGKAQEKTTAPISSVVREEPVPTIVPFAPPEKRKPGRPRKVNSPSSQSFAESTESDNEAVLDELESPEEVELEELFKRERLGDIFMWYMRKAGGHSILPHEELCRLVMLAKQGHVTARDKIVDHNQKLVVSIAYKYQGRGLDIMDLIQEGNLGLLPAIEKFEPLMGNQFSTYASWWIKQKIRRAIHEKVRLVRFPVGVETELWQMRRIADSLFIELGREPSDEEVLARSKALTNAAELLKLLGYSTVSFDDVLAPQNQNQGTMTRGEVMADENAVSPITALEAKEELHQSLLDIAKLVCLVKELPSSDRDKRAFFMYYGLNGEREDHTMETVGAELNGITREWVRQILGKCWTALEKIGTPLTEIELLQELVAITHLEKLAYRC